MTTETTQEPRCQWCGERTDTPEPCRDHRPGECGSDVLCPECAEKSEAHESIIAAAEDAHLCPR